MDSCMGKLEHGGYEVLILMEYAGGNMYTRKVCWTRFVYIFFTFLSQECSFVIGAVSFHVLPLFFN